MPLALLVDAPLSARVSYTQSPLGRKGDVVVDAKDRWALQTWESIEALRPVVLFNDVLDALYEKAADALELAFCSTRACDEGWVAVLPIVPRDLMKIQASDALPGNELRDILPTPNVPYFLVDIDVEEISPGFNARRALLAIRALHRYPLTFEQAYLLFRREGTLCPDRVFVLGSIDPEQPEIPVVLAVEEEMLSKNPRWGAPSFAAII